MSPSSDVEGRCIVAGRSFAPAGQRIAIVDPRTGRRIGHTACAGSDDVAEAVDAGTQALRSWRTITPGSRAARMLALADALTARAEELAQADAIVTGKRAEVVATGEIPAAVDVIRFSAGAARSVTGAVNGEYQTGHVSAARIEPVGVCAAIVPWNFPLLTAVWKLAPMLAAGNTVVLKPAETTPLSAMLLTELCDTVLGPGVVSCLSGGPETGSLLCAHPGISLVSFTGSTKTGVVVAQTASRRLARFHLELGGNAPVIVFADASVENVVRDVADAGFANAGQDCVAASRVIVHERLYDDVVAGLVQAARLRSDLYGLDPLHTEHQLARVLRLLGEAGSSARIETGGQRMAGPGFFLEPTVVTSVRQDAALVQREVFGPVLTIQSFADEAEALALANGVSQGLAASLWTSNHSRALRVTEALEFGTVWVNCHLCFVSEMPHGGFRTSGFGKDLSIYALGEYCRIKHVMSRRD